MGGGLDSHCVGRVYGADGAVHGTIRGRGSVIILPSLDPGSRTGWLVSTKALPLYPVKGCYVPVNIPHKFMKM